MEAEEAGRRGIGWDKHDLPPGRNGWRDFTMKE
jgi:hypothetical protein